MSADSFQRGLRLYQQGRLNEAKAACEAALNADSKHSDALHLLGLIAVQAADYERAVELMSRAIALDPDNAAVHANRGAALQMLNRPEAALASYEQAIRLQPGHAEAH